MAQALQIVSGQAPQILWHRDTSLPSLDLIVIPGGFSFGDYLRSGAMGAHAPIMREVRDFASRGGYVLGVCNGFPDSDGGAYLTRCAAAKCRNALPLAGCLSSR